MYDKEKIVSSCALILDEALSDLNPVEKVLVLTNCLLNASESYLPKDLKKDSTNLLSNGKRVSFELVKNEDNLGLNIAYHSHLIINLLNSKLELEDD